MVLLQTRVAESRQNIRLQLRPFQNFRLNINGSLAVKINGNFSAQQEMSVSTKVSKEIVPFHQEFPT